LARKTPPKALLEIHRNCLEKDHDNTLYCGGLFVQCVSVSILYDSCDSVDLDSVHDVTCMYICLKVSECHWTQATIRWHKNILCALCWS